MKSRWILFSAVSSCLGSVLPELSTESFINVCENLGLTADTGLLSGDCITGKDSASVRTYVDLNECLAWGPKGQDAGATFNELHPAKAGHFNTYCDKCVLIQRGQSDTQVGYILCSCAPKGSELKLEYSYDLTNLVTVTKNGCLQCQGATEHCGTSVSPTQEFDDPLEKMEDIVEYFNKTTCEDRIARMLQLHPEYLPPTYRDTGYYACEADPSLCCFHPNEPDEGDFLEDAFTFLQGGPSSKYLYRLHYWGRRDKDNFDLIHHNQLSMVFRVCIMDKYCPDGENPPAIDFPDPWSKTSKTKTKTKPPKTKTKTTSAGKTTTTSKTTLTVTKTKTTSKPTSKSTSKTTPSETQETAPPIFSVQPAYHDGRRPSQKTQEVGGPVFSALPINDDQSIEVSQPEMTRIPLSRQLVRTALDKKSLTSTSSSSLSRLRDSYFSAAPRANIKESKDDSIISLDRSKLDAARLTGLLLEATDLQDQQDAEAELSLTFEITGSYSRSGHFTFLRKNSYLSGRLIRHTQRSSALHIKEEKLDEDALSEALLSATKLDLDADRKSVVTVELGLAVKAVCSVGDGAADTECESVGLEISGHVIEPKAPAMPTKDETSTRKATKSKTTTKITTKTRPPKTSMKTSIKTSIKKKTSQSTTKTKNVTLTKTASVTTTKSATTTKQKSTSATDTTSDSKTSITSSTSTKSVTSTRTLTSPEASGESSKEQKRGKGPWTVTSTVKISALSCSPATTVVSYTIPKEWKPKKTFVHTISCTMTGKGKQAETTTSIVQTVVLDHEDMTSMIVDATVTGSPDLQ